MLIVFYKFEGATVVTLRPTQCSAHEISSFSVQLLLLPSVSAGEKVQPTCWFWGTSSSLMLLFTKVRCKNHTGNIRLQYRLCVALLKSLTVGCLRITSHDPEVSYAQGMNDLCSRFLEVLNSEVDAYWSFCCYMEKFSKDFRADGLHRKIGLMTNNKCHLICIINAISPGYICFKNELSTWVELLTRVDL